MICFINSAMYAMIWPNELTIANVFVLEKHGILHDFINVGISSLQLFFVRVNSGEYLAS